MRLALAAPALTLLLAPAAHAGVVQVTYADSCGGDVACTKYGGGFPTAVASFNDPAGEANVLTVSRAGAEVTFTDTAAALTAGSGCTAVDAHSARCPVGDDTTPVRPLVVDAGAGDDAITVTGDLGVRTPLRGGAGDDQITGGAEDDEIAGGPGDDTLTGGDGADTLDFSAATTGVEVDLEFGTADGNDAVRGFERVLGGAGNDRLSGSDTGDDVLDGGAGNDLLLGRGGADALFGGEGTDRLEGGAGGDVLETDPEQGDDVYTATFKPGNDVALGQAGDDDLVDRAGGRNTLRGGPGRDRVTVERGRNLLDGGPGDDRLSGGTGVDRFLGGGGADRLDARDGHRERVDCGLGRDRVKADKRDRLRRCAP